MTEFLTLLAPLPVILTLVVVAALMALGAWLLAAARARRRLAEQRLRALAEQTLLESEREHLREQLEELRQQYRSSTDKLERQLAELMDLQQRYAGLEARLRSERQAHTEQLQRVEAAEQRLGRDL